MKTIQLLAAARSSPLSKAQVKEIQNALLLHHPEIEILTTYLETVGDRDQTTSLRSLDKTDFFTKEIDLLLQEKKARIGIHSAKDLPDPLAAGLTTVALTTGLTGADALVIRPGYLFEALPSGSIIATSSMRREETVKKLRPDLRFVDIRGTIEQRLAKLTSQEVDGVVIAEAALLRLAFHHLNRIILPGATVAGQGQLAVVARADDHEMKVIFSCLDCRIHR
jgi:hydroxymethylbilane synthase